MLETKVTNTRATFARVEPGEPSKIVCHKLLIRPDGKQKYLSISVPIRDERLLARVERELRSGDEIEMTVETRWAEAGIPTAALDFSKVSAPSMTESWPLSGYTKTVHIDPPLEKMPLVIATKGKSK